MSKATSIPSISIATIVKNELHNIRPFLETISKVADEVVIVDTGSTDGTVEEIKKYAAIAEFPVHFYEMKYVPFHFGIAKNYAIDRSNKEYILVLDADERLSDAFVSNVKIFLQKENPDVVKMLRVDELLPHYIDVQMRLFKNGQGIRYGEDVQSIVHETLLFPGDAVYFDAPLLHMQGKNHWLRRPKRVEQQLALEIVRAEGHRTALSELLHAPVGFFYKFRAVYIWREAYKDGWIGFIYAFKKGVYTFRFHVGVAKKILQSK